MMNSLQRENRRHSKKNKKLMKLVKPSSDTEDEGSEHELSYYLNDRVKMMKEVLKIIKPKKIRTMAPNCMKNMDTEEINSMLLEELLGISNKRLRYIFNGQNLNEESSSTDPEDQTVVDVISLDDISDDDLIIDLDSDHETKKKKHKHKTKIKEEPKKKKVKKEKHDKESNSNRESENPMSEKNLMSVLELLELQARARAIKSQLALETKTKEKVETPVQESDNEDDAVIVESPKNVEIVITSSESEIEDSDGNSFYKNSDRDKFTTQDDSLPAPVEETADTRVKIIHQTTIVSSQNGVYSVDKEIKATVPIDTTENDQVSSVSNIPLPDNNIPLNKEENSSFHTTEKDTESIQATKQIAASESSIETESKLKENAVDGDAQKDGEENKDGNSLEILDKEVLETVDSQTITKIIEIESSKIIIKDKDECSEANKLNILVQNQTSTNLVTENSITGAENENISVIIQEKPPEKDENSKSEEVVAESSNSNGDTTKLNKTKRKILNKLRSVKSEKELLGLKVKKSSQKKSKKKRHSSDEGDGIVINLEESEMDCIYLD